MRSVLLSLGTLLLVPALHAQGPAKSTGLCNDGTYSYKHHRTNACRQNGGVKKWWGAAGKPESLNKTENSAYSSVPPDDNSTPKPHGSAANTPAAATAAAGTTPSPNNKPPQR